MEDWIIFWLIYVTPPVYKEELPLFLLINAA
jgi:hypothetical protein